MLQGSDGVCNTFRLNKRLGRLNGINNYCESDPYSFIRLCLILSPGLTDEKP